MKELVKGIVNKNMSGDHRNYSIIEIGQKTDKMSWRREGTYCHSHSRGRLSGNVGVKNSQKS